MNHRSKDILKMLTAEFQRHGVEFDVRVTGRTHVALSWQVGRKRRSYYIPGTSGDRRAEVNTRAGIRRMFRADDIHPLDAKMKN